ncbi:MAG: DUF2148 domain-containing protein [Aigarchaeota archaeon]|nr:DUF2148 domain-containing protein [Aigarchaeota archaeon]MDW7986224.1 DUF2148 domain-containing protein [Nitrososphaerota archaeon]
MSESRELMKEAVLQVAKLMAISAITAPKARGVDNIIVKILSREEEIELLAKKMEELSEIYGDFFKRDAQNIRKSIAVVLIGCKIISVNLKTPPQWKIDAETVHNIVNLGIALGSAVKTSSIHNVDNRIMFSAGVAAQELKMLDVDYAFAIPLNVSSKSIYFDRVWPPK